MYDEKAFSQEDIAMYDAAMTELDAAKRAFKKDYGIDIHDYKPIVVAASAPETRYAGKELQYAKEPKEYKPDLMFEHEKRKEAYFKQYPDDKEVDRKKWEMLELDKETQEQIDEHNYNEALQAKYHRYFQKQAAERRGAGGEPEFDPALEGVEYTREDMFARRVDGKELDDQLVRRIAHHLDDSTKHIRISQEFQEDMNFEEDLKKQHFDVEGYEQLTSGAQADPAARGDYDQQQELLF